MNCFVIVPIFFFFLNLSSFLVSAITPSLQIEGLEYLFNATNGAHWNWKNEVVFGPKWSFTSLPQSDPCNDKNTNKAWQGITCSSAPNICKVQACDITSLELDSYKLDGSLPYEFFMRVTTLTKLQITSSPKLTGPIPTELGLLTQLKTLYIFSNLLRGQIPSEIGLLTQLNSVDLDSNQLTGPIPSELGLLSQLISLYLYTNQLSEFIPSEIGLLSEMKSLSLQTNLLRGSIPSELGGLVRLGSLSLQTNQFTGAIPSQFGLLTQLNYLSLDSNLFSGSIPPEISSLSRLNTLYLDSNHFTGTLSSKIGYFLTKLKDLRLHSNQLSGSLPSEFGSLIELTYFDLHFNRFIGPIPSEFGLLVQVKNLYLDTNELTGTIPSEIALLSQLTSLHLHSNLLTGLIPPEIGLLSQLNSLYLLLNELTGPIPSEIGMLLQLNSLYLSSNQLTGPIPSEIGSATQLNLLNLYSNHLTGTIPSELSSLTQLEYLYLHSNDFSGSIPSSLFNTTAEFIYLDLSSNHLFDTIPSEIGSQTALEYLYLFNNSFTGTIPSSIINLKNLTELHLHQNHLNGEITFQLHSLPSLKQLFLQQNLFHGRLHQLFSTSSSLNSSTNHPLMNIDVSDNQFSGSIPSQLFLYPNLQSISLSLNCFQHELPSSMCEAVGVGVISMDGLGSSKHCPNLVKIPFTSVSLVQSIEGSIPDCVWLLSNLKTLNLAGNGLSGSIGKISSMSSLLSLTLSHNYLSGTIPMWLQERNMSQLDLSHNKLMGRVDGFKNKNKLIYNEELVNATIGSKYKGRSLKLSVNRLSGDLSHSFDKYSTLDILSGNLFSCDYTPSNDENSDSTICGSEEFDQSMITMGGVCGLILILAIFYGLCLLISLLLSSSPSLPSSLPSRNLNSNIERMESQKIEKTTSPILLWFESRLIDFRLMIRCMRYYSVDDLFLKDSFNAIRSFGYFLSRFIKLVCLLTIVLLIFSLPIYILKVLDVRSQDEEQSEYITHSEMYRWLWTMSFISGTIPSVLLMVAMLISLMIFCLIVNTLGGASIDKIEKIVSRSNVEGDEDISPSSDAADQPSSQENPTVINDIDNDNDNGYQFKYFMWLIFVVNIAVVGTVNALYLWSTLKDFSTNIRILIQFSFGLFTFVWRGIILRGGLPTQIKESRYGVWLFTCLNIMNTVIIPCVVTALSDPSCYQRLLIPPDDISSSYTYQNCYLYYILIDGTIICALSRPALMDPLKITPPFSYSYQCGSTLLVSYIPVYMYSVSLQFLSAIVKFGLSFTISSDTIQIWLMKWLTPINFPSQFTSKLNPQTASSNSPIQLVKPHQIISIVMNNLILLLTFGLCSPVLGCYITLNICVTLWSWLVLIGRFVYLRHDLSVGLHLSSISSLISSSSLRPPSLAAVGTPLSLNTTTTINNNHNDPHVEMNPILNCDNGIDDENKMIENSLAIPDRPESMDCSHLKSSLRVEKDEEKPAEGDEFLNLLNRQLQGVNTSLVVCKWPIICTSCLFVTLLCWDMAGDEMSWFEALWVPGMGLGMLITIWIWDQFLTSQLFQTFLQKHKSLFALFLLFPSSQS